MLSLEPASLAQGVVLESGGAPVAGAFVRSQPSDGPPVLSGADGAFMLQIPAGGVTLEAQTASGRRAVLRLNAAPARQTVRDLKLVIDEGSDVTGRVVDAPSEQPVVGATVHLFSEPDALEIATGPTNAAGQFHFVAIPTGRYSIFAQAGRGARGRTVGVELPSRREPVVRLTPAASIAGRVVNPSGQPVAFVEVTLEYPQGLTEPNLRARSSSNGEFVFEDLLASVVTVGASDDGLVARKEVYAAPDHVTRVDLAFQKNVKIMGRVLKPTRRYRVAASKSFGPRGQSVTETDALGHFELKVTPGTWRIYATTGDEGSVFTIIDHTVEVKAGEDAEVELQAPDAVPDAGALPNFFNGVADGIAFDAENGSVKVGFLTSQSLAFKAGLRSGDLVVSINEAPIASTLDAFEKARVSPAEYVILRTGTELRFRVTSE